MYLAKIAGDAQSIGFSVESIFRWRSSKYGKKGDIARIVKLVAVKENAFIVYIRFTYPTTLRFVFIPCVFLIYKLFGRLDVGHDLIAISIAYAIYPSLISDIPNIALINSFISCSTRFCMYSHQMLMSVKVIALHNSKFCSVGDRHSPGLGSDGNSAIYCSLCGRAHARQIKQLGLPYK